MSEIATWLTDLLASMSSGNHKFIVIMYLQPFNAIACLRCWYNMVKQNQTWGTHHIEVSWRTFTVEIWNGVAIPNTGSTTVSYFLSTNILSWRISGSLGIWLDDLYATLDLTSLQSSKQSKMFKMSRYFKHANSNPVLVV